MPKRASKKKRLPDPNVLAFRIVQKATEEPRAEKPAGSLSEPEKNPHAVALGRLGGAKGGLARAAKLSKKKRSQIAKKAAVARWKQLTQSKQHAATSRPS